MLFGKNKTVLLRNGTTVACRLTCGSDWHSSLIGTYNYLIPECQTVKFWYINFGCMFMKLVPHETKLELGSTKAQLSKRCWGKPCYYWPILYYDIIITSLYTLPNIPNNHSGCTWIYNTLRWLQTVQLSVCVSREYSCQSVSPDSTAVSLCLLYCHLDWRLARSGTYMLYYPEQAPVGSSMFKGNLHGQSTLRTFMCVFIGREEREVSHPEKVELLRIKTQVSWLWQDRRHLSSDISQSVQLKNRVWSGALYKQIWWKNLIGDPSHLCLLTTLVINDPRPSSSVFACCEWSKTGWWERGWLILALGIND